MARVFSDLRTAGYGSPGHPEAPFRVSRSHELLTAAGLAPALPAVIATEEDVRLVHGERHFEAVKTGRFDDPDTAAHRGIGEIALISLSGAISAADAAVNGDAAFSLMRPPGHHAGKDRVAGFCYVNNLAVAAARLQKNRPGLKVGIVDFDVHHGDGTESIVLGRENVSFVSLHQFPLYPGTGGESRENCLNVPLPAGTDGDDYLTAFEPALERILASKPDVLAVSAGFDAYKEDPIAGLALEKGTFKRLGALLAQTRLPRFAVLEGGYSDDLPRLIEAFLAGFF